LENAILKLRFDLPNRSYLVHNAEAPGEGRESRLHTAVIHIVSDSNTDSTNQIRVFYEFGSHPLAINSLEVSPQTALEVSL
jgi:hypothetical protein